MSTGPLLALELDRRRPLGRQLEDGLRSLVRGNALPVGARLPSTRSLAGDLGVSRGVVVGAYAQLAAEGYLTLRPGASPVVAAVGSEPANVRVEPVVPIARATCLPDLGFFPRAQWLKVARAVLQRATSGDLSYGEPFGTAELRGALAPFLARTRGVVATPERTAVFGGSSQALHVLASVLRASGARRIGVEDPSHRWRSRTLAASGLELVPVPVDEDGLRVDALSGVDAVVVSPDHQFPLGVALSPERRRALVDWAAAGDRLVIEHDYDGHFRYDRMRTGALQALAPEHVAYVGTASALLAPTLRIGWAVLPARLVIPAADQIFAAAIATSRLTQLTLAEFVERGYLDRHLHKSVAAYRRRREALLAALAKRLPDAPVLGSAAGLFLSVKLPDGADEARVLAGARSRGLGIDGFNEHAVLPQPPGVVLGFASAPEPILRLSVRDLAAEIS